MKLYINVLTSELVQQKNFLTSFLLWTPLSTAPYQNLLDSPRNMKFAAAFITAAFVFNITC